MKRILASFIILALLGTPSADAQRWADDSASNTQQSGNILTLANVRKKLQRDQGGRYIDAELIRKPGGGAEYHVAWEKNGRKLLFVVDAYSGRLIRTSGG